MRPNYIAEINAFERWIETNYLPPEAQLLWYRLIALFNRSGWSEWITVDNLRLMSLISAGEKKAVSARNCLVENGLIEFQKGTKRHPNKYKLCLLSENLFSSNNMTEITDENTIESPINTDEKTDNDKIDRKFDGTYGGRFGGKSTVETADIYKLNKDKNINQQQRHARAREEKLVSDKGIIEKTEYPNLVTCQNGSVTDLCPVFEYYGDNIGELNPKISEEIIKFALEGLSAEVMMLAIDSAIAQNVRKWTYISKILKNKLSEGITTPEQWENYELERENKSRKNKNSVKKTKPDYAAYDLDEVERYLLV